MKKIITIPNKTLREKAKEVLEVDKKLKNFISEFEETLDKKRNPRGIGLAAPQVDKLLRIFSINLDGIETYINPKIIKTSKKVIFGPNSEDPILEACLSIPNLYGPVPRFSWIEVEFQIIENDKLINRKAKLEAFKARVFQHEFDHLNGILFTDYSLKYNLPVYKGSSRGDELQEVDPALLELY
ncbi:peptide deformylase [Candidatus Woesebacteria bacterium]|nr:peptide deformylase [Candidatus Woesebacteria bacterium]